MFDIASWKAGVTVSRSCAAASTGTKPGKAAIAASVAAIAIDGFFNPTSPVLAEDDENRQLSAILLPIKVNADSTSAPNAGSGGFRGEKGTLRVQSRRCC